MADKGKRLFCPTVIRSPPFYQNFYGSLAGIQQGKLYYPLGESVLTHVDFNDVADTLDKAAVEAHRVPYKIRKAIEAHDELTSSNAMWIARATLLANQQKG